MESVIKGLLRIRWQPQLQFVRNNTKVNVTKPRPPHFERALVERICLPYFSTEKKEKHVPDFESCVGPPEFESKFDENHPLVEILAEKNFNDFNNSKLIAFFHSGVVTPEEKFEVQLLLKKKGMRFLYLSKHILKKALRGTQFESVLPFYEAPTGTAFCPEPDLQALMKIHKKLPKMSLMAAIVDNKFLSLSELNKYALIRDITDARLALVSVLNTASQQFVQQLNSHPSNLVRLLSEHKKQLENGKN